MIVLACSVAHTRAMVLAELLDLSPIGAGLECCLCPTCPGLGHRLVGRPSTSFGRLVLGEIRWGIAALPTPAALDSKLNKILVSSLLTFCTNHLVALAVRCAPGRALIWAALRPLDQIPIPGPPCQQRRPQRPGPPYQPRAWAFSLKCSSH